MKGCYKVAGQASYMFYDRYRHIFHMEASEVKAEAYLAMAEALVTFDPTKGRKLESWIVFIIKRELRKKFLKIPMANKIYLEDFENFVPDHLDMERSVILKEALHNLSPLSKEMFQIILDGKLKTEDDNKNTIKRAVVALLREKGYGIQKIKSALRELKTVAMMPT